MALVLGICALVSAWVLLSLFGKGIAKVCGKEANSLWATLWPLTLALFLLIEIPIAIVQGITSGAIEAIKEHKVYVKSQFIRAKQPEKVVRKDRRPRAI